MMSETVTIIPEYDLADFDPHDYDVYHLGVSGGKDSTAVLLWVVYESGWPLDKLVVTFCDTNNEEALTYAYLNMLSERVFPIETVEPEMDFWELARKKKRFPGARARFCTQHLKLFPSMRYIDGLRERGNLLLLSGSRKNEGKKGYNNRAELNQFRYHDLFGSDEYLPVYDWSLPDVWAIQRKHLKLEWVTTLIEDDPELIPEHKEELTGKMRKHRVPRNPLYDMGAVRVGCFPCINSRKAEVRAMAKYRPGRITFISDKEHWVGEVSNFGFSSFFPAKTVPEAHRTKIAAAEDGRSWRVCDIHDVVRWSQTAHGGKQYNFDFHAYGDEALSCDVRGMCE